MSILSPVPEWSPVILTVYNRPEHFRTALASLRANKGAEHTTLYISSDGPKSLTDSEDVLEVREVIKAIEGFKDVIVFAPNENTRGKIKAQVIAEVKAKHPAYIFAEDDIFFGPDFLSFVNSGLRVFAGNSKILAICGYLYPGFPVETESQLYLKCFTSWGYGTWSDREAFTERQDQVAREIFASRSLFDSASNLLPHTIRLSREILRGNLVAADITACNRLFIEDRFCVFPPATLVRNMGFDGSGQNCKEDFMYSRQQIKSVDLALDPKEPVALNSQGQKFLFGIFGGRFLTTLNRLIFIEQSMRAGWMQKFLTRFIDVVWEFLSAGNSLLRTVRNTLHKGTYRP